MAEFLVINLQKQALCCQWLICCLHFGFDWQCHYGWGGFHMNTASKFNMWKWSVKIHSRYAYPEPLSLLSHIFVVAKSRTLSVYTAFWENILCLKCLCSPEYLCHHNLWHSIRAYFDGIKYCYFSLYLRTHDRANIIHNTLPQNETILRHLPVGYNFHLWPSDT